MGVPVHCDVTRTVDVDTAVAHALDQFGGLDALIACAGTTRDALVGRLTDEDWQVVLDTNLTGTFRLARAAQEAMSRRRYGRMVFLSSIAVYGNPAQANYASAKAGLVSLARTLALELAPFNVTVNVVAPGWVDTPMARAAAEGAGVPYADFLRSMARTIPLRRVATADELAGIIAFLCSQEAGYITGQTLVARGGP